MAPGLNMGARFPRHHRRHQQHELQTTSDNAAQPEAVTTSFLLGNLHCPTCVSTIREVLHQSCADHVRWVSPNIVTSVVTVEHDAEASLSDMAAALADAGFDICGATTSGGATMLDMVDGDSDPLAAGITAATATAGPSSSCSGSAAAAAASKVAGVAVASSSEVSGKLDTAHLESTPSSTMPSSSAATASAGTSPYWGLGSFSLWSAPRRAERRTAATMERIAQAHLDNCEQCRLQLSQNPSAGKAVAEAETEELDEDETEKRFTNGGLVQPPAVVPQHVDSSTSKHAAKDRDVDEPHHQSFVAVESEDAPTWKVNLAVGGMTCAVCVNAITDELGKRDWVNKVSVNLISNSATVELNDKDRADDIVEAIEDLGYDAAIDSVVRVDLPQTKRRGSHQGKTDGADDELAPAGEARPKRTVEIRIDGLYCGHCPDRVVSSLAGFRRASLQILTKPTPQRPILQVEYEPDAPHFTIRHILAAIEASDAVFAAAVYHPPTLEERSRMIQRKHQRTILYRVIFAGLTCIPTFVIGIVYMSLLPSSSHGHMYLMMPWTSGISRAQVALFILATPVYFFGADIFHVRAVKEIRTLWRRGSRTPILQRFYRFGSMNTLMSLGTTIAYVSSVSQMIAAAAYQPASISDANFYFDSVVFLTFFLLVGRLIESYSKSRTGDAVEMLGRLRPTTAILVEGSTVITDPEKKKAEENGQPLSSAPTPTPPGNRTTGTEIQADLLDYGDTVRVLHGASPPADGVIVQVQGSSPSAAFDESSLTGESRLVPKAVGENVFAGTVNKGDAPVLVQVTGASGTSMLDQIVAVVREGQTKRAPMEQIADLLTTYFVPVVTLVAITTWIIWLCLGVTGHIPAHFLDVSSGGGWVAFSLQFAIAVFVVACPCGLGLAAPTAIFVAGGLAAKYGVLAKGGGEAFEKASRIDCIVFDKTGTLTVGGEPTVTDSAILLDETNGERPSPDGTQKTKRAHVLSALRAVEENSSHPVAKAIVSFCTSQQEAESEHVPANTGSVDSLREIAGRGMQATYHANSSGGPAQEPFDIIVGNEALMADFSVAVPPRVSALLQKWKADAKSVALVATRPSSVSESESGSSSEALSSGEEDDTAPATTAGWSLAAALSIADPVRPEAAPILAALQARGVLVYMLSGDNSVTAAAVARQIGIPADQVIAEVLPTEKAAQIQNLQASLKARRNRWGASARQDDASSRATIAMVGDGINDSPALTQADVGIAVGSGSDVAISSADFVLVQSNLQAVVTLLELSRAVFRRIAFNFGWALIYNVVAVPIAAGVLYPIKTNGGTTHVRLDPVWASLAMALSSISVVLSSLTLRSRLPGVGFRPTVIRVKE